MVQQTALQIFWNKIALKLSVEQINEFLPEFQEAKAMEKEQIIKSNRDGVDMCVDKKYFITGEQYYNETYNQNK
jgi:hypothetical protein